MNKRVNIPVRVIRPGESTGSWAANPEPVARPYPPFFEQEAQPGQEPEGHSPRPRTVDDEHGTHPSAGKPLAPKEAEPQSEVSNRAERDADVPRVESEEEGEAWRDRALRLQAEMDNFRKRQQRRADEQIEEERGRMLGAFLQIVDDLERALGAPEDSGQNLRRGVELIHRSALRILQQEGVEPMEAQGRRFDPNWHEAVATIPLRGQGMAPYTITQVVEPGYRLRERLLRPAKVVVAVE